MKISDYAITMTSLEQIFNRFAKKAEAEELELMKKNQQISKAYQFIIITGVIYQHRDIYIVN